jgi:integrase
LLELAHPPQIFPLSRQAVEILRELQSLTRRRSFVFPGVRSNRRPMSDNAILAAMQRMGIGKDEMSRHGFRAVARTTGQVADATIDAAPMQCKREGEETVIKQVLTLPGGKKKCAKLRRRIATPAGR